MTPRRTSAGAAAPAGSAIPRPSSRLRHRLFRRFYWAFLLAFFSWLLPVALFLNGRIRGLLDVAMDQAGILLLGSVALALVVAGLFALVVARRLTRQVADLRREAEEMGYGSLGREIRLESGDELEDLAGALNRMSRELANQRTRILAEKEQLLRVLEGMIEGVLVVDRGGRILQTNEAFQKMFGLTSPALGKTSLEALRNPGLEEALAQALLQGERADSVIRVDRPAERHVEVSVAPLGGDGQLQGAVAVFHDVTRLKRLEDVRREFVANISHEIRTPVTAIRGYAETLRDSAESAADRARFAEIIVRHADRLTHIVDDLLALSSLESAGYALNLQQVRVGDVLQAVEEAFAPRAAEKGLALTTAAAPAADLSLACDRRLLEQVLGNLVDNAINYTDSGGRVTVSAGAANGAVEFKVADTGSGIPASDLQRVFQRFFRVDRARSRKLGGTGLGLAIVKHIVALHGGEVAVRSRLGEGSDFTVKLPVDGPPKSTTPAATQ